eukprot:1674166-Alexandrium_andersonii.AAC.1
MCIRDSQTRSLAVQSQRAHLGTPGRHALSFREWLWLVFGSPHMLAAPRPTRPAGMKGPLGAALDSGGCRQ